MIELLYCVNLSNGNLSVQVKGAMKVSNDAVFDNIHEAEYCSLNIARQNILEDAFKNETFIEDIYYRIHIINDYVHMSFDAIVEEMQKIKLQFSEYFI